MELNSIGNRIFEDCESESLLLYHTYGSKGDPEHHNTLQAWPGWEEMRPVFLNKEGWIKDFNTCQMMHDLFGNIMAGLVKRAHISWLVGRYEFQIRTENDNYYFTPLITRCIIRYLRMFKITIFVEKCHNSLVSDFQRFITELVLNGKTEVSIPQLDFLKDDFFKIKTGRKFNPWIDDGVEDADDDGFNEANARFRGAEWFMQAQNNVSLIGCGGLGSNIAVSLCRVLGNRTLYLYDNDIIEHRNLAGQNFGVSDIGFNKASVVDDQCKNFNPMLNASILGNFTETCDIKTDVVITGLDNMASRSLVYYKWKDSNVSDHRQRLLIDARLSAEKWQILCIDSNDKEAMAEYEDKWLFLDNEAEGDVCSYKQTAYAAQMCASFVTNIYVNWCSNLDKDNPLRRFIPFLTEYDAGQMILRVKQL